MPHSVDDAKCDWRVIADTNWTLNNPRTTEAIQAACLKGIYEELKRLNAILSCPNFTSIPQILRAIKTNTAKPRKPKAKP